MISVTCSRPFSELGDQQLLEQTRRLAANQRGIEVHILDHLDEIDRRGLALRRGFSSLFDYAVRELRFTDAAAQRRIQTMRLCRRHGWVRAMLQSGELNLTSAAQLETTFAGAERAERQCRTGRRNDGQGRCHEQEQWARPLRDAGDQDDEAGEGAESGQSLGKRPREAGGLDAGERMASAMATAAPGANGAVAVGQPMAFSRRSAPAGAQPAGRLDVGAATGSAAPLAAPGRTPRAEQCSGDAVAAHAPPVAPAGAQDRGARHALPAGGGGTTVVPVAAQDRGIGHASTLRPQQRSGPGGDGGCDASRPATELNGADDGPAPEHVPPTIRSAQAPEPVAAPAESLRAASRAPESSRDDPFAELSPGPLSAAPLLHPQRQRELIEQAAGMSTRQVTGLLAAAAPEVVPPRDTLRAVAPDRYTLKVTIDQECEQGLRLLKDLMSHLDPRMSWGDLVARLVRETVVRHDPRGGGNGQRRRGAGSAGASPRRSPNKTRAAGAAAGTAQRVDESSQRAPKTTRAAGASAAAAQRGGDTPAPPGDTAAAERQNPIAMLANAAPPRQSVPVALSAGARAGGVPSAAPGAAVPVSSVGTPAPKPALGVSSDGGPSDASAVAAAGAEADGSRAGAAVSVSSVGTPAPERVRGVLPDGGAPGASAFAAAHTTRDSVHSRHQSAPRRHIPAAVRRHVWLRDGGRCCYRDPLTGRRCTSSHLLQIDHLLPVAQGGGPEPSNLNLLCFAHHRMRHGHGPAALPEAPM